MATAMNARQVSMFTSTLSPSVAMRLATEYLPEHEVKNETATPARLERTMIIAITAPPPAHPPDVRPERLRRPGERGAGVRRHLVELPVTVGHEQHRDEPGQEDRRHLQSDLAHRGAKRRGERVSRGHRRNTQNDASQGSNRTVPEPLVLQVFGPHGRQSVAGAGRICHLSLRPFPLDKCRSLRERRSTPPATKEPRDHGLTPDRQPDAPQPMPLPLSTLPHDYRIGVGLM